jgi:hypothetical protein
MEKSWSATSATEGGEVRRLAVVDEPWLRLIRGFESVYALVQEAIRRGRRSTTLVEEQLTKDTLEYDAELAKSPGDGASGKDVIFSMLADDQVC